MSEYAYPLSRHQSRLTNVEHSVYAHLDAGEFVWIDNAGDPASTTLPDQFSGLVITSMDVVGDAPKSYPTLAYKVRPGAYRSSDFGECVQTQEFGLDIEVWCNISTGGSQDDNWKRTAQQRRNILDCLKLLFELNGGQFALRDASNTVGATDVGTQTGWLTVMNFRGWLPDDSPGRISAACTLRVDTTHHSSV